MKKKNLLRRKMATARLFTPPSVTHGFKYLYFPARSRIPAGQMRGRRRQLGIDNNRVLDIHYPERQVIAILVHNDFADEFLESFAKFRVTPLTDYDPLDPTNLKGPKFADMSENDHKQKVFELRCNRMLTAVSFIRALIKFAVACDFAKKDWLSDEVLADIIRSRHDSLLAPFAHSDQQNPGVEDETMSL